jgi:hypothetical protein
MIMLQTHQVRLGGATRSGPRFALDLAGMLEAGIAEAYPGETIEIVAFDSRHVVYRLGGGELLASSWERDGGSAVVSESLWPHTNPTPASSGQAFERHKAVHRAKLPLIDRIVAAPGNTFSEVQLAAMPLGELEKK